MYAEYGKKEDKDNSYRYYRMEDFIYDYTFKDIYMFQDVPKTMQSKVLSRLTFTTITKAKKKCNTKNTILFVLLYKQVHLLSFFLSSEAANATCTFVDRHELMNVLFWYCYIGHCL